MTLRGPIRGKVMDAPAHHNVEAEGLRARRSLQGRLARFLQPAVPRPSPRSGADHHESIVVGPFARSFEGGTLIAPLARRIIEPMHRSIAATCAQYAACIAWMAAAGMFGSYAARFSQPPPLALLLTGTCALTAAGIGLRGSRSLARASVALGLVCIAYGGWALSVEIGSWPTGYLAGASVVATVLAVVTWGLMPTDVDDLEVQPHMPPPTHQV